MSKNEKLNQLVNSGFDLDKYYVVSIDGTTIKLQGHYDSEIVRCFTELGFTFWVSEQSYVEGIFKLSEHPEIDKELGEFFSIINITLT